MMSIVANRSEMASSSTRHFEQLLLGDLQYELQELDSIEREGWLLALLDKLLTLGPHASTTPPKQPPHYLAALNRFVPVASLEPAPLSRAELFKKLRRLRDRIAHRSSYQILANEVRCDLAAHLQRQSSPDNTT
jgi:hypothetical protein